MSFLGSKKAGRRIGAIVLAAAVGGAVACSTDREDVVFQVGDFVFDFLVDQQLAGGYPAGTHSINEYLVAAYNPTAPDGFERIGDEFPGYDGSNLTFGPPSTSDQDGRAPTLSATGVATTTSGGLQMRPPWSGPFGLGTDDPAGHWWFIVSGALGDLPPSLTYTLALVRYGVDVKGELDQFAILTGQPIAQRDSLVVLNPNPGGDASFVIGSGTTPSNPDTLPTGALGDANPWVVGQGTINASGQADFGFILPAWDKSTMKVWYNTGVDDLWSDSILAGNNEGTAFAAPRFNYVVMYEGVGTSGQQIARWQIAQDLDLNGQPLNNAFYPYPTAALSASEQLALPCCAGQASDLTFSFDNLDALTGGAAYTVWLYNEETGAILSPSGDWEAKDAEGNVANSASGVNSFPSQAGWTHTFTTSDALAGQNVGPYTHVVLSVEAGPATEPSDMQPLWSQYTDMAGQPEDPFQWSFTSSAEMAFGSFRLGNPPSWVFNGPGLGEGGYWGQEKGVSDLLVVNYRNLQLPPTGYFYEAWLIGEDGSLVRAGELMTTFEEGRSSLRDLDANYDLSDFISTDGLILRSETVTTLEELGGKNFYDFVEYRLTLSPKMGAGEMPSTTVMGAATPEPVLLRKPAEGS